MEILQNQISEMVRFLPETELKLVVEVVRRFLPDYVATSDDLEHITMARQELTNGETTNFNDIDWD